MAQELVRDRRAMLAGMTPVLKEGKYVFCTTRDEAVAEALAARSLAMFREEEGIALVLSVHDAAAHAFDVSMPMARIVLEVFSALDGVGLTAGVASALADEGIPCNMIAAYHHDNVFVPQAMSQRAVEVLLDVQRRAGASAV
jgi:uncharacterized protein